MRRIADNKNQLEEDEKRQLVKEFKKRLKSG